MFGRKKTVGRSSESVYSDVTKALTSKGIKFNESDAEKNTVYTTFEGDDFPVKLAITVDDELPVLCFNSLLDFQAPPNSYKEILDGLNLINSNLHFGAFILDPENGRVVFRYHFLFAEYVPSKDMILALTKMVVDIVGENDGDIKKLIPEHRFNDPMFG